MIQTDAEALRRWLAPLGLGQYASLLREQGVDLASLKTLSIDDLEALGLGRSASLAIATKAVSGDALSHAELGNPGRLSAPLLPNEPPSEADRVPHVERRHLTVLFCDMVGSTEWAYRLDPEDFRRLMHAYMRVCGDVIERHDGLVATYSGDAVVAYFGYPVAFEDDAERGVCAGLEILNALDAIANGGMGSVRARLGIASGLVVVGYFHSAAGGVSLAAFGHPIHLAQRLQALAEPDTILTDDATREAAAGAIDFVDRGLKVAKGFDHPVPTYEAVRAKSLDSRFARRTRLTKLCGRDAELAKLVGLWDTVVTEGRGRVVLLSGEAGIGKSRLLHEVRRRVQDRPVHMVQCSERDSAVPLSPFLAALSRDAGLDDGQPPEVNRAKLTEALSVSRVPTETSVPLFADLLAVPIAGDGNPRARELSSESSRATTQRVIVDWLRHSSARGALLLVEDEQWADATSRALLGQIVDELNHTALLVLVTRRTGTDHPRFAHRAVEEGMLNPLTAAEATEIIRDMTPGGAPPDPLVAFVLTHAEGVPLFVEEFARSAIEFGVSLPGAGRTSGGEIPNSLQSLLLARLDRLGTAKEVAQTAAIIGRDFDVDILSAVSGLPETDVREALADLVRATLVVPAEGSRGTRFSFKHALLQRAAQDTILRARRNRLHETIARTMAQSAARSMAYPERIAFHFEEAGLDDEAAAYWLQAGMKAGRTWAKVEAAQMFKRGIEALKRQPETAERNARLLELELERGDVLYAAFGYVTGEGSAAYHEAMTLSEKVGDPDAPVRALDGLFGTHFNSGEFGEAINASERLIELGERCDDLKALVLGLQFKGMSLFCRGQLTSARLYLERALQHEAAAEEVGSDFPSMAMIYLAWTLHILGDGDAALAAFARAQAIVRKQSPYRLAACLGDGCILYAFRRDLETVDALSRELAPLARWNGFKLWEKMAHFFEGWVAAQRRSELAGADLMRATVEGLEDQQVDKSCFFGLAAAAYLALDRLDDAAEMTRQGIQQSNKIGEHYYTAELFRLRGEIEARRGALDAAEASLREAIAFAQGQAAAAWERAARDSLEALKGTGRA